MARYHGSYSPTEVLIKQDGKRLSLG